MLTAISAILIFSILVLVHEYGHYKAALSVGIKVEEFAIGMGPMLYKREKNGIVYSIRAIPIGGFVKMEGEEEDIKSKTSFSTKTVWQRFKVIAAGPVMNFVLALVLFIIIALSFGILGTEIDSIDEASNEYIAGIRSGDKVLSINNKKAYVWEDIFFPILNSDAPSYDISVERNGEIKEYTIEKNYRMVVGITPHVVDGKATTYVSPSEVTSPAYKAGISDGDKVIKVNDKDVSTWEEITNEIGKGKDSEIKITVERNGEIKEFIMNAEKQTSMMFNTVLEKSFLTALVSSAYKTVYYIQLMFDVIFKMITGKLGSDAVGGPVMVINMVGEAAKTGILPLLNLAAFISINLGFMNLLPIPALDGSKLMFLIIEAIRGKAIPIEKESFVHFVGFILLITLMIFITYKDIMRIFRI